MTLLIWPSITTPALLPAAIEEFLRYESPVETALCPHGGGPPICWCRPPLPGLVLAFARARHVDVGTSILVGTSPAHRALAEVLGASYIAA